LSDPKTLDLLFPGPRRAVFAALYSEPSRWWSLPELAGRAGVNPSTLRGRLSQMRTAGLIRQKTEAGRQCFQPDPSCPVFAEMQGIVTKLIAEARATETILIVEDQEATAQITRILLESWGYRVLESHSGREALDLLSHDGEGVQLVLTDVIMPGMSGPQLASEIFARRPELRIVFMSGYPSDQLNQPDVAFLPKPFNPASLSRMIRKELDRPTNGRRHMKGS
jgi:CheY-like chemotaxis protein